MVAESLPVDDTLPVLPKVGWLLTEKLRKLPSTSQPVTGMSVGPYSWVAVASAMGTSLTEATEMETVAWEDWASSSTATNRNESEPK